MSNTHRNFQKKLKSAVRYSMVHCLSGLLPLYIINEYPKSGGSWLGQMLERALGVPFPRNCFPVLQSSIMHGHYLSSWGMKNVVVIWRDGRDVMVSWYYHCLFKNEIGNSPLVDIIRKDLPFKDYDDIHKNLPIFIEYSFTRQRHPKFSWADFVKHWHSRGKVTYVQYEALRQDPVCELQRIVLELAGRNLNLEKATMIAEEFSFERQAGRQSGQEKKGSFMRKGVVGDWRNHFSKRASEVFEHFAGQELILLGYEQNSKWVNTNQ